MLDKLIKRNDPNKKLINLSKKQIKLIIILAIEFIAIALVLILIFFSGKKSHTVKFDLNGGILISGDLEQRIVQGHNATPPSVAKYGHYLRGWSGSYKSITQDVVIKAIWEYETTAGIEYSVPANTNYCEISNTFKEIQGEVFIGSYYGDRKVLGIQAGAFKDRTGITAVHLLDGILSINDEAFSGCTALEVIDIPSTVVSIGAGAFKNCKNLTTVVLPDSIKTIGQGAFEGCENLTTIIIPASLELIPANAFKGCAALESVTITDGVKRIGASAFSGCNLLKEIYIPRSVRRIGASAFTAPKMTINLYVFEDEVPLGFISGWCPEDAELIYGVEHGEDDEPIVDEEEEADDSTEKPGPQFDPDKLFPGLKGDESGSIFDKFPSIEDIFRPSKDPITDEESGDEGDTGSTDGSESADGDGGTGSTDGSESVDGDESTEAEGNGEPESTQNENGEAGDVL